MQVLVEGQNTPVLNWVLRWGGGLVECNSNGLWDGRDLSSGPIPALQARLFTMLTSVPFICTVQKMIPI